MGIPGQFSVTINILVPQLCASEIVTTTDGRQFNLKADGTYFEVQRSATSADDYLVTLAPFFERHVSKYGQKTIRFMPKFENKTDTAIIGIKFNAVFKDAFGATVYEFNGDVKERIDGGAQSTANVFYYFEDNQFMGAEPYDKLMPMIQGNTGSIQTNVTKIALEGGKVVDFTQPASSAISTD